MRLTEWKRFSLMAILLVGLLTMAACDSRADTAPVVDNQVGVVGTETVVDETAVEGEVEGFVADESAIMTEVEVITDTNVITETMVTEVVTETQVLTGTNVTVNTVVTTDMDNAGNVDNAGVAGRTIMGISGAEGALIRGATLLDQDFTNRDGEVSGDLENMLIDMRTGDVLFTSIKYGAGFLNMGGKDIVVPLSAFAWGTDNNLVLNFDEQTLENFPDVGNNWPDLTDPTWDDDVNAFWRNNQFDPGFDFTATNSNNVMWLSDMVGYQIFGLGDTPGNVSDVLVDMGNSRVKYIVLEYGGIGTAEGARLIPFTALNTSTMADGQLMFGEGVDMDMYNASPLYDPGMYDNNGLLSPEYATEVDTYWNERGFGQMD